jgi:TFIIF-interacting CTD phosphatase-like protein
MGRTQLLLDLDNTLICSEIVQDFPFNDDDMKRHALKHTFHNLDGEYILFERPGLQEFLDYACENFDVSIWTAACKDYALFIIKNCILTKPNRRIHYFFFRTHCSLSKALYNESLSDNIEAVKCIKMLEDVFKIPQFMDNKVLILDDLEDVYYTQPDKCIGIKPFEITEKDDDNELMGVVKSILDEYK